MALRAFDHVATPPFVLNVAGPEVLRVRAVAEEFGRLHGQAGRASPGDEAADALLSNAQLRASRCSAIRASTPRQLIEWIADWVMRGGETLGKPTHFEVRDGRF